MLHESHPANADAGPPSDILRAPHGSSPQAPTTPLILPPDTSPATFQHFCARASSIVGRANVTIISDAAEAAGYDYGKPSKAADMFPLLDDDSFLCSAVIAPQDVPQTQDVVRLANEIGVPLWPFSVGRNLGYGGAAPRVSGSVGLDMGRHLRRILKVDVEGAYAVVEPGVTFLDLHQYLVENGLRERIWVDCPDLGGGSVLGNTIERGVGYTVSWEDC